MRTISDCSLESRRTVTRRRAGLADLSVAEAPTPLHARRTHRREAERAGVGDDGRAQYGGAWSEASGMDYPESYELIFQAALVEDDVVIVRRTDRAGAGGYPVYEDETGIVRAEISDRGEVRMLASGGHQAPGTPTARALSS